MLCSLTVGEMWRVNLTDAQGHEQLGERPALVIGCCPMAELATVVPFTSKMQYLRFPFTLKVQTSSSNGLTETSIALIYQQRCLTAKNGRFINRIGIIEPDVLKQIRLLLKDYLSLNM